MRLYYSETMNPRKACAAARYLDSPVEFVRVDLQAGEHKKADFLRLNPNGRVPVLQVGKATLWEANAIMCRLSDEAGADFWPHDERQIDVIRWFSWDAQHFTRHAGTLYFENLIKPAIGLGAPDAAAVELATCHFRAAAAVLDAHLVQNSYLVGAALTVADFATAVALPYAERIHLPLDEFPAIQRWRARLNELPAWREPFPH
ncbi:glutathione S-transferase family protein [Variovorax sp. J31P179]|uniref:glutathione S-transferase family protein n=1 Tax=Variovorax sp. J31P179 TaxID=3053508 RepID=UPI002576E86F|nr:glutathione S-transferase family protein [Variovorax sp. J31P179]MDM0079308.1 glutathione S-transferase family protein [Variovorax sp. J31P179]